MSRLKSLINFNDSIGKDKGGNKMNNVNKMSTDAKVNTKGEKKMDKNANITNVTEVNTKGGKNMEKVKGMVRDFINQTIGEGRVGVFGTPESLFITDKESGKWLIGINKELSGFPFDTLERRFMFAIKRFIKPSPCVEESLLSYKEEALFRKVGAIEILSEIEVFEKEGFYAQNLSFGNTNSLTEEEIDYWLNYLSLYGQPDYWTIAENLPIHRMEKGQKGTYLNLGIHRDFDIVAIYKDKEIKLWRIPSKDFYKPSSEGYEQVVEHRGKEEVVISDNRHEDKFLSHNADRRVKQGFYFGKSEKEFKLKERWADYDIFNSETGYRECEGLYNFLDKVIDFAEEQNLPLNEAAVKWAGSDFHIAKINGEDSFTINLETKLLTKRSVRNGKVSLRRGVHPGSKPVKDFIEFLKINESLTGSFKEDTEAFLLKEMDDSLRKEMSYLKDSYSLEELLVLSRYPNYLWVLDSSSWVEDIHFYYLKWTSAVRQSKLMKKGEFLKIFMPKLGKKTANRLASSSTVFTPSSNAENWSYAFMGRLADPKLLMKLAEKIADYNFTSDIKSCLYLDNQVHQGLSFLTLERWLERKGLSERLVFLINKMIQGNKKEVRDLEAIQSNREEMRDLMELRDSMHILVELYESYQEAELSELAEYRSITDFHDALVRILRRQEREVSETLYIYSKKAEGLTLKSGQWEIALPDSEADIVDAGDLLSICVGSSAYTSRHNKDGFYILFLKQRGRLMAVIELKDKGVHQFKFKYNNVFHRVQLEDRKELSCFITGWMEKNKLTDRSYDLAGLDDTDWTNNHPRADEVVRVVDRDGNVEEVVNNRYLDEGLPF